MQYTEMAKSVHCINRLALVRRLMQCTAPIIHVGIRDKSSADRPFSCVLMILFQLVCLSEVSKKTGPVHLDKSREVCSFR